MPASIETYAPPTSLYRFRSIGSAADPDNASLRREIDAIRLGQFWCGEYSNLNDAMEGLYTAGDAARGQEQWEQARALIRSGKASVGIACFSEVPDQALMWAQYADSFRGICIEYDFGRLRQTLPDESSFSRVSYADRLFDIGADLHDTQTLIKWILSTKHHSWGYEREWRLFAPQRGLLRFSPDAIRRVILGPRILPPLASFIRHQLDGVNVQTSRVRGYNIEID